MNRAGVRVGMLAVLTTLLATSAGWCWVERASAERAVAAAGDAPLVDDPPEDVRAFAAASEVANRLRDERDRAIGILITPDASIPSGTLDTVRESTDAEVGRHRELVADQDGATRDALAPALAAVDGLPGLRSDVDALLAAPPNDVYDTVTAVFFRYGEPIAALRETSIGGIETVDLPPGREEELLVLEVRAAVLAWTADDVVDALDYGFLSGGLDEPTGVDGFNALLDSLEAQAAAVKATAPPYQSLIETGFPEKVHEQLVSEGRAVLAGGSADPLRPGTVEELAEEIDDVTYIDLLENVLLAETFADSDRRDERVAAAEDRRAPWVVASIVTTGLALLSLLALVTRALRTSRSGGTPRSHDESHPDLATMLGTPAPESPS